MSDEISRIKHIYDTQYRQNATDYNYIWHARNPVSYTFRQAQERAIIRLFNKHKIQLEEARILDVGCGGGGLLCFLLSLGAVPKNLYGVDLMEYRIEYAQLHCPSSMHFSVEDAQQLPFEPNSFDMVSQFTVFSSILNQDIQHLVAKEMGRVVKSGGLILWYDMKNRYPATSNIQGIDKARLAELFPGYVPLAQELLHHKLISRLARRSWFLCELVERIPGLPKTHMLALLKKP